MRIKIIEPVLIFILFFLINCTSVPGPVQDPAETISVTGIFDGRIITEGNFQRVKVYKINGYCISLKDISPARAEFLKGKKIKVTGKLKIVEGIIFPPKSSASGSIYEPYKEPDKRFINKPVFIVIPD